MKIHLIASTTDPDTLFHEGRTLKKDVFLPMGLASISSYLKLHGYEVSLTDLNIEILYDMLINRRGRAENLQNFHPLSFESYLNPGIKREMLAQYLFSLSKVQEPDLVGISCLYTMQPGVALTLAREIKKKTNAKIVIGGIELGKSLGKDYLEKCPFVDYVVTEAGELPMLRLAEHLEGKRSISEVPGLMYRDGGEVRHINELAWVDLKTLPLPDYESLPLEKYRLVQGTEKLLVPYQFIRGCLFKCSFCRFPLHNKYLHKDPAQVAREIEELKRITGSNYFFFLNNLLNVSAKYVDDVSSALEGKGIFWCDSARPSRLSRRNLENMKRAGCVRLTFGVETIAAKGIELFEKGFLDDVEEVIRTSHDVGIWNAINILVGYPHQTECDLAEDLSFMRKIEAATDDVYAYRFNLGDSPMLKNPERYNIRITGRHPFGNTYEDSSGKDWESIYARDQSFLARLNQQVKESTVVNFFGERQLTLPIRRLFELTEAGLTKEQIKAALSNDFAVYKNQVETSCNPSM